MRNKILWFVLAIGLVFSFGAIRPVIVDHFVQVPNQVPWHEIGTITATNATFAVGARDVDTVEALADANTAIWTPNNSVAIAELRFRTTTNADSHVVEMWVAADDNNREGDADSYMLGEILTLTGGQQVGTNSDVFVDTLSLSSTGIVDDGEVVDSGNDRVAIYRVNLRGYRRVAFIATTFEAGKTLTVDARWYGGDVSTSDDVTISGTTTVTVSGTSDVDVNSVPSMTKSESFQAAQTLIATNGYSGAVADLAADGAYDYSADIDMETNGYKAVWLWVEHDSSGTTDDIDITYFSSPDGTNFDDIEFYGPIECTSDGSDDQIGFYINPAPPHGRIGYRTNGTTDTFDVRIKYRAVREAIQ